MQKKRKDKNFRVEEKDKYNRARKLIRENNKIKAKERDKKRLVRENNSLNHQCLKNLLIWIHLLDLTKQNCRGNGSQKNRTCYPCIEQLSILHLLRFYMT
jgi:hypothetical protein